MKIEIKNIKHSAHLSEETEAFTATLYIEGKKAAYVRNDGQGGPTNIVPENGDGRKLVQQAVSYCRTLPPILDPETDGLTGTPLPMDLELFIDTLLFDYLKGKDEKQFQRKIDKAMLTNIVVGSDATPDEFRTFRSKRPISDWLQTEASKAILVRILKEQVLPKMQKGEQIVNRNIPAEIFKAAGLTQQQYILPPHKEEEHKPRKKGKGNRI